MNTKIGSFFQQKFSAIIIWLIVPIVIIMSFSHHRWVDPGEVIAWDVKSYYAYLPATFIYKDLSLSFAKENSGKFSEWIWPTQTPTGKSAIITSMGLSVLYLPFFLIAHAVALISPQYQADGYTEPYAFALHFSALFYLILGLFALRKFLRYYFSEFISILAILIIFFGTNLIYYTAIDSAMPHSFNFSLFCIFLLTNKRWHDKPSIINSVLLGLLYGFIVLVRPTNVILFFIILFWNVYSRQTLKDKMLFFVRHYSRIILMISAFLLAWLPQFIYWKYISGQFFFFSYGGIGGKFFWDNPQFGNILFSFRKGWFIYTPLALVAIMGLFLVGKKYRYFLLPVGVFVWVNIYVQASWWCWWFGGSFGLRAFVDSYAILTIPLAVLISRLMHYRWRAMPAFIIIVLLVGYNLFQVKQYRKQAIHYWWMSKDAYCKNFMRKGPAPGYWEMIPVPDYAKARKGIYVAENLIERYDGKYDITPEMIVSKIRNGLSGNDIDRGLHKRGNEHGVSTDSLLTITAWNIYETKWDLSKYITPMEDSLKNHPQNEMDSINKKLQN